MVRRITGSLPQLAGSKLDPAGPSLLSTGELATDESSPWHRERQSDLPVSLPMTFFFGALNTAS